jgi:hypothetical protein
MDRVAILMECDSSARDAFPRSFIQYFPPFIHPVR